MCLIALLSAFSEGGADIQSRMVCCEVLQRRSLGLQRILFNRPSKKRDFQRSVIPWISKIAVEPSTFFRLHTDGLV